MEFGLYRRAEQRGTAVNMRIDASITPPNRPKEAPCFPLASPPAHIRPRYRCLALIARHEELDSLNDDDTLAISCDWLLAQNALNEGRHCVYFELGLLDWHDTELVNGLFVRAQAWVYEGGRDITLFREVSLGKMFGGEMSMALMNYHRLDRAIRVLVRRFGAESVLFYDFMNEINILDRELRCDLARNAAWAEGAEFLDRSNAATQRENRMAERPHVPVAHPWWKSALLATYVRILETASRIRSSLSPAAPRVLLLINTYIAETLIAAFKHPISPVFMARGLPRQLQVLSHCFVNGIRLAHPHPRPLNATDHERLAEIEAALERAPAPADSETAFARTYAVRQIVRSGRLREMARDVLAAEGVVAHHHPARIVVDGLRNVPPRIYVELAHARGIPVDYIWHSTLVPMNNRMDALIGDSHTHPLVSRCLSWGDVNDAWLDRVSSKQPRVRVGSPHGNRYAGRASLRPASYATTSGRKALILQYTPQVQDVRGLNANAFEYLVTVVRTLRTLGFSDVRIKLHPGPGRWRVDYYEELVRYFSLDCPVLKHESFPSCLAWADIVIGPLPTGAMMETLAAGKPYYAFLIPPHTLDSYYYGDYPVLASADELGAALKNFPWPTAEKVLEGLYAVREIPDSATRFWEVLSTGPSPKHATAAPNSDPGLAIKNTQG